MTFNETVNATVYYADRLAALPAGSLSPEAAHSLIMAKAVMAGLNAPPDSKTTITQRAFLGSCLTRELGWTPTRRLTCWWKRWGLRPCG